MDNLFFKLKGIIYLLLIIPFLVNAQQESTIKEVKSSGGKIEVSQYGKDSSQKSTIDSITGDSIDIKVVQNNGDSIIEPPKTPKFQEWISNTNNLLGIIISLIALIGFVWKGIPLIKKLTKKK